MMRSGMPEQIHQGLGSLSEVARRMFMGGEVSGHPLDQYGQYLTQTYAQPIQQSASQAVDQFVSSVRQKERDYFGGGGMGAGMGAPLQGGLMGSPTDAGSTLAVGGLSAPTGQVGSLGQNPSPALQLMPVSSFDAQVAAAQNTPQMPYSPFPTPDEVAAAAMGTRPRPMVQVPAQPSPFGSNIVNQQMLGQARLEERPTANVTGQNPFGVPPSTDSALGRLSATNATAAFAGRGPIPNIAAPMQPSSVNVNQANLAAAQFTAPSAAPGATLSDAFASRFGENWADQFSLTTTNNRARLGIV